MSENKVIKILFVCYGNTCRSPMAEAVMKHLIKQQDQESRFQVESAGISSWQKGQEPNDYVKMILKRNHIAFQHKARQISVADFEKFDYILGMDHFNVSELNRYAESLNSKAEVKMLGLFNPSDDKVISDPYFDNRQEDFEKCFVQISESCRELVKVLLL